MKEMEKRGREGEEGGTHLKSRGNARSPFGQDRCFLCLSIRQHVPPCATQLPLPRTRFLGWRIGKDPIRVLVFFFFWTPWRVPRMMGSGPTSCRAPGGPGIQCSRFLFAPVDAPLSQLSPSSRPSFVVVRRPGPSCFFVWVVFQRAGGGLIARTAWGPRPSDRRQTPPHLFRRTGGQTHTHTQTRREGPPLPSMEGAGLTSD